MYKLLFILLFITSTSFSQNNYNTKKGAVANGYDVVAYFNNEAKKGTKKYSTVYDNVTFRFSSKKNLTTFKEAPEKYICLLYTSDAADES